MFETYTRLTAKLTQFQLIIGISSQDILILIKFASQIIIRLIDIIVIGFKILTVTLIST